MSDNLDDTPVWTDLTLANIGGRPVQRLAITLRTRPCRFQDATDSCRFCELRQNASNTVTGENLINQVMNTIEEYKARDRIPEHVDLFGLGTFFDDIEIPAPAREEILGYLNRSSIKSLLVESRAEYVTRPRIRKTLKSLSSVDLEVAIGIESTNPNIRERILNKRYREESIERAVGILGETGTGFLGYVLLKPAGVFTDYEERKAIDDVVKSSLDILQIGKRHSARTRIGLNPFYLPDSHMYSDEDLQDYSPPSLWSVVDAVRQLHPHGTVFIGLNSEGLATSGVATSCHECDDEVRDALQTYNGTRNIDTLLALDCKCREEYIGGIR